MKKISLTLMSTAVLFLFSCDDTTNGPKDQHTEEIHNHDDHAGHDHTSNNDNTHIEGVLTLNNGKKWDMSTSLMDEVIKMSLVVDMFEESGDSDYSNLAIKLNDGISNLINKCDLPDGVAHENLHEWLHPFMGLVKELSKTTTPEEGKAVFVKIQESFVTYGKYFE